jgi:hypothetical protein
MHQHCWSHPHAVLVKVIVLPKLNLSSDANLCKVGAEAGVDGAHQTLQLRQPTRLHSSSSSSSGGSSSSSSSG